MKVRVKRFLIGVGYILSFMYPYLAFDFVKKIKSFIYSGYIKRRFKSVGANFNVEGPVYSIGSENIIIGNNFNALSRLWIDAYSKYQGNSYTPQLIIGDNVNANFDLHIGCINKVYIGNNVLIASKVYITDHFHGDTNTNYSISPVLRPLISKGPVIIEDNVWIGEGVVIMPNVTIGKNCIIGAYSVVTKSFTENSIIVGSPARLLKTI